MVTAEAKEVLNKFLVSQGFTRGGLVSHEAADMDFEAMGFLGKIFLDPDADVMSQFRQGVPIGWRQPPPRTPAVFERKHHWKKHHHTMPILLLASSGTSAR